MIRVALFAAKLLVVFAFEQGIPYDCRKICSGGFNVALEENVHCPCMKKMGDIMLSSEQFQWIKNPNSGTTGPRGGSALREPWKSRRTTDGFHVVPFIFSNAIFGKPKHIAAINKAVSVINALTCLKFQPATVRDEDKLEFFYGKGCFSGVGKLGGTQKISIGRRCDITGIVLHEIMHALGFWHEHSRHDRDEYVRVLHKNIKEDAKYNFFKKSEAEINTSGSPYDVASIMHYDSYSFSRNKLPTLLSRKIPRVIKSQRYMLSKEDQFQLRAMYECGEKRGIPETTNCMHPLDRGVSYTGTKSYTVSGIKCQRWNATHPHSHSYSSKRITGISLENNYCRNPDVDEKPWCYTVNKDVVWEYCDIPECIPAVPTVKNPVRLRSTRGFWTDFTSWSACTVTCGRGLQTRTRHCIGSTPGSSTCPGSHWESKECFSTSSCPAVVGQWTIWNSWSACSAACGKGRKYRVRGCSLTYCGKDIMELKKCKFSKCPLYPDRGCYDPSEPTSYRGKLNKAKNGRTCLKWTRTRAKASRFKGNDFLSNFCRNLDNDRRGPYCYTNRAGVKKYCDVSRCRRNAAWISNSHWSSCNVSCGGGVKFRTRICVGGVPSQGLCQKSPIVLTKCNTHSCSGRYGKANNVAPPTISPDYIQPTSGKVGCAFVGNPQAYRGTASTTYKGLKCQHWDAMHPHQHNYRTIEQFRKAGLVENYCRAPEEEDEWPWCYVLSYDVIKQACDIPVCPTDADTMQTKNGCFDKTKKQKYRGVTSTTLGGHQCQRWDKNYPHPHLSFKPFRVLNQGLGSHNYCRNPDGDSMPWCITTNIDKYWEYCNVTLC